MDEHVNNDTDVFPNAKWTNMGLASDIMELVGGDDLEGAGWLLRRHPGNLKPFANLMAFRYRLPRLGERARGELQLLVLEAAAWDANPACSIAEAIRMAAITIRMMRAEHHDMTDKA